MNFAEDRVLVVDLDGVKDRGEDPIECWGNPLTKEPSRGPVVI